MKNLKKLQCLQRVRSIDGLMQGLLTKFEKQNGEIKFDILLEDGAKVSLRYGELISLT